MTAIAIIGAMDEEVANIATALSNVTVTEEAGVKVTRGTLETNKGTAVNVAGQALVPTIVSKREGILDEAVYNGDTIVGEPELFAAATPTA